MRLRSVKIHVLDETAVNSEFFGTSLQHPDFDSARDVKICESTAPALCAHPVGALPLCQRAQLAVADATFESCDNAKVNPEASHSNPVSHRTKSLQHALFDS